MNVKQVWSVYWSAAGATRQVTERLAEELARALECPKKTLDFTPPAARQEVHSFGEGDLVVVGSPTYAGKLPNKILPDFQTKLAGNGALAVAAVTFGNRSFDNSLAELCATLEAGGFHTVAGGAFVCRHAFTDALAPGRPNAGDMAEIAAFAAEVAGKVRTAETVPAPVAVEGDAAAPYYIPKGVDGQPAKFLKAKPVTDMTKCTNCGQCVRLCPVGSIDAADVSSVPGVCIKCQACVRGCPTGAKSFDDAAFLSHVAMLEQNFTEPKVNRLFL